jgi:uncharacterized protein (TIGR02145 family)
MKKNIYLFLDLTVLLFASGAFAQSFTVNLRVFLEGPCYLTSMSTFLNNGNYIPLSQPYNVAPWNYSGTESVASMPNCDVVDWVLVELRETAGDASTAYQDDSIVFQAGFILSDGMIVSLNGETPLQFNHPVTQKLYAVVHHRNHLPVMSASQLAQAGNQYSYDFTTYAGQALGGVNAQKQMSPGLWAMIAGDGNADGQVNNADKNEVWKPQAGYSGYLAGDYNMNGQVDNTDKNDRWKGNGGRSSQVTGPWLCGKVVCDPLSGQPYATVKIGNQCWMAENLNTGTMIPGPDDQTNNGVIEKYCYHDSTSYCDVYGGLYQWNEIMQYVTTPGVQGICPPAWHLPTDEEWCIMEQVVDPAVPCSGVGYRGIDAGGKLKETGTGHWAPPNTGATNSSGFRALPDGLRYLTGVYAELSFLSLLWSSTEYQIFVWYRILSNEDARIFRTVENKNFGASVRCLKDPSNLPPGLPFNPSPPDDATGQPLDTQLMWTCFDPEYDPLTYDVYLGMTSPPPLVSEGQDSTTFDPGMLEPGTIYFWRIVVHDDHGNTITGPLWRFMTAGVPTMGQPCPGTPTVSYGGQIYNTVLIGNQCWLKENLNIGEYIDNSIYQEDNGILEKYCYDNDPDNCDVYGGLYRWGEMMQYSNIPGGQGVCPSGWHIPILKEFDDLFFLLGGTAVAGGKMKEAGTLHWNPPNTGATNESGFTALPGGSEQFFSFYYLGDEAWFWTSDNFGVVDEIRSIKLVTASSSVSTWPENDWYSFSIRCLKD